MEFSRERSHAILDSLSGVAVLATNSEGIVTEGNRAAEAVLGWTAQELVGRSLQTIFDDDGGAARAMAAATAQGHCELGGTFRRRDGSAVFAAGEIAKMAPCDGATPGFALALRDASRERETLRAAAAARDQMAQLFEQAPTFMALLRGPEHRFELTNPGYLALVGHRQVVGQSVAEALPDAVEQGFLALLDEVYRTGRPFAADGYKYAMQAQPGGPVVERFVDFVYQPIRDPDGAVAGIFVEGADVTDRTRAAQALREQEGRYRTIFNAIDEGFCIIEFRDGPHGAMSDYVHLEANAAFARHAGLPDAAGRTVRELVPDEAAEWVALYGRVLETGEPLRFQRELAATGRHLELAAFRIEPASLRQVAVLFQDITERRRAETALRQLNETLEARITRALAEQRLLAQIVETTDSFVHVVDLDYRWLALNEAGADEFERIFGVRPQVGDRMLDLLAGQPDTRDRVAEIWGRALAGEEFTAVSEFGEATGHNGAYEMKFNTLRDKDGRRIGAFQVVTDITARVQEQRRLAETEEALRQSHKMEAVGQLTGGLAHDFNNLLAGISGSLELMGTRIAQGRVGEIERYLLGAQGAAKRAAALTHRLLAFSRRQTLEPKPTDVNRLVSDMEELIRRTVGPQVAIETVAKGGLWPTLVDPNQLENALLNLCINARDAMPDGGRIVIETANRWLDDRAAAQRDLPPGQYVSMCVSDDGTGMSPEVVERAFDPFFTTKPLGLGTGLGLSMIYGFARQSGGQVRIYSELGAGTMVCVYLPRHHAEAEPADPPPVVDAAPPAATGKTILVVDDEPLVRMLVVDVVEDLGFTALEAGDGPQALAILRSAAAIDLLVTDVGLPNGMNGRQVAEAARELRPGLQVLFVTGYAENAVLGHGHLGPGMQVVTKPFDVQALMKRIRSLVAEAPNPDS